MKYLFETNTWHQIDVLTYLTGHDYTAIKYKQGTFQGFANNQKSIINKS